jgi:chlorite dismutase
MTAYEAGTHPATFIAGARGEWRIDRILPIAGEPLLRAERIDVRSSIVAAGDGVWSLRGVAGHARYVERREKTELDLLSPPLGRAEAVCAALIPIKKSAAWWAMPQDERRAVLEERSHHIRDSVKYLPRVARRLFHARDLGEPFDFLTWFEFAPEHAAAFDELVAMLRAREEWTYVEREVDVRLSR